MGLGSQQGLEATARLSQAAGLSLSMAWLSWGRSPLPHGQSGLTAHKPTWEHDSRGQQMVERTSKSGPVVLKVWSLGIPWATPGPSPDVPNQASAWGWEWGSLGPEGNGSPPLLQLGHAGLDHSLSASLPLLLGL